MEDFEAILNEDETTEQHHEELEGHEEPAAEVPAETGEQPAQVAAETKAPEDVEGIKAAMLAERRKRQDEAAARQALETELAALRKAQETEKPFLGEEYEQRFSEMEQAFQQRLVAQKLELSEAMARTRHEDFNDKLQVFAELLQTNPALRDQMLKEVDPAEFAYKAAADHLKVQKLREIGDPDEYQTKLRDQIKAELMAEMEAAKKSEVEAAIRSKLKGGFSEERSAAGRTAGKQYTGPTPLKSILG